MKTTEEILQYITARKEHLACAGRLASQEQFRYLAQEIVNELERICDWIEADDEKKGE